MTQDTENVNSIAPLKNVTLMNALVERVMNRSPGLPGMATFHGFSGYGKTSAATYVATKYRCYHIQVKSVWTQKHLCEMTLLALGIQPARTIPKMVDQIGSELALSGRPLLVDEADFLVQKRMIEVVRDIYESSAAAIILIGEEHLP
ncbi:MAG: ATP-binding protein, partial [Alphaproteobacteria bacterium]|nr:ATP-binding protein [Alphaproteobacteria bacterium]